MNKVILIGRITKDVECKKTTNETSVAQFTIAVNRPVANANGDKEADFINCVVYGKLAENVSKYVGKGSQVGVDGRIQVRKYTAQDGSTRYVTEVICNNVVFLGAKSKEEMSPYDMPNPNYKGDEEENLPF